MKKYRIKTEGKFIAEFGHNWKNRIAFKWTANDDMNYLFNQPLEEVIAPESLRLIEKEVDFKVLRSRGGWSISKDMITVLKKVPNTELINTIR